jgi:NAD(P)-dependent dehydrogenase (short-subunit alcohol dehydrogenase family)
MGKLLLLPVLLENSDRLGEVGIRLPKHALHGFFDAMRAELYNDNIKVLLVCPGFVRTNVSINALNEKGEAFDSKWMKLLHKGLWLLMMLLIR